MSIYKELPRLKGSDYTGEIHIEVENHTSLSYPRHWHDYFELELLMRGTATHDLNGTAYAISPGDAYILTPVDFHEIKADTPIELVNISFDALWLSEEMRSVLYASNLCKTRRFDEEEFDRLTGALELLRAECKENGPCIRQLLEYILSRFVPLVWRNAEPTTSKQHQNGIMRAVEYIELHFREKITLEALSRISGYHPAYFSSLFSKVTGQTYLERLTALRIDYAKMLLTNGVSVSEACFASGFGSLSNFLSMFKQACGMPPSEYRKATRH